MYVMAVLVLVCAVTAGAAPLHASDTQNLTIKSETAVHTFAVEVMRTPADRARGLMHRKHLAQSAGMLFDFGKSMIARMWMKNTYIPLDMLFVRDDGVIANIVADTVPHSTEVLSAIEPVRYVLEINAGLSRKLGISPGDRVELPGTAN